MTKRTVFSRINNASRKDVILYRKYLEKYSSGRRGAPAKGIGRVTGARVQIPLSPLLFAIYVVRFFLKKLLTNTSECDNISELLKTTKNIDN